MKKILKSVLFVVMLLSVTLFALGCTNSTTTSQSTSELESVSTSESVSDSEAGESSLESIPDEIIGAGENGEVNLGDVLDVFAPVLNNDYITVNFTTDNSFSKNGSEIAAKVQATAFVKKTARGYDVVGNFTNSAVVQGQITPLATVSVYYVNGVAAYGLWDAEEQTETAWYKMEVGSFNALISQLNIMIASDPDAVEAYKEAMEAVEKLEIILSEQDLTNKNHSISFNLADYVNQMLTFVIQNKDAVLYDFLLTNVVGVDATNPDAVLEFENYLVSLCEANPTLGTILDNAIASLNETLMDQARAEAEANGVELDATQVFQLDLEVLLDTLQAQLEVDTATVIGLIKSAIPALEDYLTEPEDGESLYDYLTARLALITVNDVLQFVADEEITLVDVLAGLKAKLQGITLGGLINGVIDELVTYSKAPDTVAPGEGGEVEQAPAQKTDYIAMIEQSEFSLQALIVGFIFKTDAYGRITELGTNSRTQASMVVSTDVDASGILTVINDEATKVTFSYGKIYINFEIPEEVLENAQDAQA